MAIRDAQKNPEPIGAMDDPFFSSVSYSNAIKALAQAIARAEGFYIVGSAPNRAHNPGAMKVPGWKGQTTGSEGITVFGSDAEGWQALYRQLNLIASGRSGVYTLGMSIEEMARRWTATQQSEWAANVSQTLGVPSSTSLSQVLA